MVHKQLSSLQAIPSFHSLQKEAMVLALAQEITNPDSFKKTHDSFHFKLNAILAAAKQGHWHPALVLQQGKQVEKDNQQKELETLNNMICLLISQREGIKRDIETVKQLNPQHVNAIHSFELEMHKIEEKIVPLLHLAETLEKSLAINEDKNNDNEPIH